MRTTYVFIYLFYFFHFLHASVHANPSSLEDHWASTKISISKLKTIAINKNCQNSPRHFKGCVFLINSLLGSLSPAQALAPFSQTPLLQLKNFGTSQVILRPQPHPATQNILAETKSQQEFSRSIHQLWEVYFALGIHEQRLDKILDYIHKTHLQKHHEPHRLMGQALSAYYEALYFDNSGLIPGSLDQEQNQASHEFAGIGIEFRKKQKGIEVLSVFPGGPADKARLKPYDLITSINNTSLNTLSEDQVIELLMGPINSKVHLLVSHPYRKEASFKKNYVTEITLRRKNVIVERVRYNTVFWTQKQKSIPMGYIQIDSFGFEGLAQIVKQKIQQAKQDGVQGLILDLSNNYGGYVDEALQLLELFLPAQKPLLIEKPLNNFNLIQYISNQAPATNMKIVVMINSQSASASEIVAGTLKHYRRALLVGERSFGKGTVQTLSSYPHLRKTIIKKTTDVYLLPSGKSVHSIGVQPHIIARDRLPNRQLVTEHLRLSDYSQNPVQVQAHHSHQKPHIPRRIQHCLFQHQRAKQDFLKNKVPHSYDYRFLVAKDVLACDLITDLKLAHKTKKDILRKKNTSTQRKTKLIAAKKNLNE